MQDDDDDFPLVPSDMFFSTDYVHHEFNFGGVVQSVDALKAASVSCGVCYTNLCNSFAHSMHERCTS